MFTVLGWRDQVTITPSRWGNTPKCFVDRLVHGVDEKKCPDRQGIREVNATGLAGRLDVQSEEEGGVWVEESKGQLGYRGEEQE